MRSPRNDHRTRSSDKSGDSGRSLEHWPHADISPKIPWAFILRCVLSRVSEEALCALQRRIFSLRLFHSRDWGAH